MKKSRVSQKSIATELGISISTVSRALRGIREVDPAMRQKILALAKQLGYRPNKQALGLLANKTNTLGIIIPEIESPYFASILNGIEHEANKNNYLTITFYSNDSELKEQKAINELLNYNVDGIAISPALETSDLHIFENLKKSNFPLLFFDRVFDQPDFPKIVVNNREVCFEGTQHLIEQGYKKIAILSCAENVCVGRDRVLGYLDALRKNNLGINEEHIVHNDLSLKSGVSGTEYLLTLGNKPDAIICLNDLMAAGAMGVIRKYGLNIPEDIGVMGFSNAKFSPYLMPALTTISHPTFEMGRMVVKNLIEQINSEVIEVTIDVLKAELIIRESTNLKEWE